MQMQQAMKTRTSIYSNKSLNNDSSSYRSIRNINDKPRSQNADATETIKEQLEQSLRAQRLAYKRSSTNNDVRSASKNLCQDFNSHSPVTSSSTQHLKLVPGKIYYSKQYQYQHFMKCVCF